LCELLPQLVAERGVDFVVANCENAAGGFGITQSIVREVLAVGVDVITMGNHMWARKDVLAIADSEPRLLRPANYPAGVPGVGAGTFAVLSGGADAQDARVGVVAGRSWSRWSVLLAWATLRSRR
jgi:hypothetical protein